MLLYSQVTETKHMSFAAEASDLRWRGFPRVVETEIGNGQPFFATHVERREGDLLWVEYHQKLGCVKLTVFND